MERGGGGINIEGETTGSTMIERGRDIGGSEIGTKGTREGGRGIGTRGRREGADEERKGREEGTITGFKRAEI